MAQEAQIDRFALFTEPARKVLELSSDEERRLNHKVLRNEHFLLGLARHKTSGQVLHDTLGVDLETLRNYVIAKRSRSHLSIEEVEAPRFTWAEDAKNVIRLAVKSAQDLDHKYMGISHIVSGLARVEEGFGYEILMKYCQAKEINDLEKIEEVLVARFRLLEAQTPNAD